MIKVTTTQTIGQISTKREIEFEDFDQVMSFLCWEADLIQDAGSFFEENMYEEPKTDDDSTKH